MYRRLGGLRHAQGFISEAEGLFAKALELRRANGDETSAGYGVSLHDFAAALASRRRPEEAEPLLRQALAISRSRQGDRAPETIAATMDLAKVLVELRRLEEARSLATQALEAQKIVFGPDALRVASGHEALAGVEFAAGNFARMEELVRTMLAIRQARLGDGHPLAIQTYTALANAVARQGRYVEAESLHRQAVDKGRQYRLDQRILRANATIVRRDDERIDGLDPLFGSYLLRAWQAATAAPDQLPRLREAAFKSAQEYTDSSVAQAAAYAGTRRIAQEAGVADVVKQQLLLQNRLERLAVQTSEALAAGDTAAAQRVDKELRAGRTELAALSDQIVAGADRVGLGPVLRVAGELLLRLRKDEAALLAPGLSAADAEALRNKIAGERADLAKAEDVF